MNGFKTAINRDFELLSVFLSSSWEGTFGLVSAFVISSNPVTAIWAAACGALYGLARTGIQAFQPLENFDTVRESACTMAISSFTKVELKKGLRERYEKTIIKIIEDFINGPLQTEITTLKNNLTSVLNGLHLDDEEHRALRSLDGTISKFMNELKDIESLKIQ